MKTFLNKVLGLIKSEKVVITILYSLSYGLILLNDGLFWDDWTVFNQLPATRLSTSTELGFFINWSAYLHNLLLDLNFGIYLERGLIFFAFLFAAFFLFDVLGKIKEIDPKSKLFIVLLFALFPLNALRIAICTIQYSLSYFMFFSGFWLLAKFLSSKRIVNRMLALVLIFISYSTNSLLAFYPLLILFIIYADKINYRSISVLLSKGREYLDFVLSPIIFIVIKFIFYPSYGEYAGYNQLSLDAALSGLITFPFVFYASFIRVLHVIFIDFTVHADYYLIIAFLVFALLNWHFSRFKKQEATPSVRNHDMIFLGLGFLFYFLGALPYLIIGKIPTLNFWDSRFQLLLPLGASLILYYSIRVLFTRLEIANEKVIIFFLSLVLTLFVAMNISVCLDYQKDWFKQLSLIGQLKSSKIIRANTTFLFTDEPAALYNAGKRHYAFYEYTGLLKYALADDSRFGDKAWRLDLGDMGRNKDGYIKAAANLLYNMGHWEYSQPQYEVTIVPGDFNLSTKGTVALIISRYLNKAYFAEAIKNGVSLKYRELHGWGWAE